MLPMFRFFAGGPSIEHEWGDLPVSLLLEEKGGEELVRRQLSSKPAGVRDVSHRLCKWRAWAKECWDLPVNGVTTLRPNIRQPKGGTLRGSAVLQVLCSRADLLVSLLWSMFSHGT